MKKPYIIIVLGPTGVGKTSFVDELATVFPLEIVNGDMGQLYTPLTIGTAKPDWRQATVPHHLFDLVNQPILFSSLKYRKKVELIIKEIWQRDKTPVIVGGSSFYLLSLFFPPSDEDSAVENFPDLAGGKELWDMLHDIDSERAKTIDPQDSYRLTRALSIWKATGKKPSELKPVYDPIASSYLVWLNRDRKELYQRIDKRVLQMIDEGWLEEVKKLQGTEWDSFLREKKIIGYDLILDYFLDKHSRASLIAAIQKKTRNYAKRQITFWKSFKRKIEAAKNEFKNEPSVPIIIREFDLTHGLIKRYIKQLKKELETSS